MHSCSFWRLVSILALSVSAAHAGNVLTQHYSNARVGATLDEITLNTSNVQSSRFGKLWTLYADGQVVAEPLYVRNLQIDTTGNPDAPDVQGTFNAVIIATMHNTIYVYDADREAPGPQGRNVPLWATWLGQPRPGGKDIDMWSTNDPEWGILSTPVISPDRQTLYVVAWQNDGAQGFAYRLHALDLSSGSHRQPAVVIGKRSTDPGNPCRDQSEFNPCVHKQRAALLLDRGVLFIGFGGDGNRGALFAFDAQTLMQRGFWGSTSGPGAFNGGIWQSGQGPAADTDGNLYLQIGNGKFDADQGGANFGNSVVKLSFENNQFTVADWFTPCNQAFLDQVDLDLGSAGAVLLPERDRIVGGGKEGRLYLLDTNNLGRYSTGDHGPNCQNANAVQQVMAFPPVHEGGQEHHGNIHGSPVYWRGPDNEWVYAWGENGPLKAYRFRNGRLTDPANPRVSGYRPPMGMPGGMLTLSANNRRRGSGILWAVVPLDGDANKERGVEGIVLALDAEDVSRTLWTSQQFGQRDRLGLFAKFASPVVADGKLFVATYGNDEPQRTYFGGARPNQFPVRYNVAVYGLLPPGASHPPIVNQDRDDVTLVRATTEPLNLDLSACMPLEGGAADCTQALEEAGGAPAFHALMIQPAEAPSCSLVRVTVASKNGGLANTQGIGFWSTLATSGDQAAGNSGRFLAKGVLQHVGLATLANGGAATLHEFVGAANCTAGAAGSTSRLFKPYMQFLGQDGTVFRNWDTGPNYRIGPGAPSIDRSAQVLGP